MKMRHPYVRPNFFRRNFSFKGTMGGGEFWANIGTSVITYVCLLVISCIVVSVTMSGTVEQLSSAMAKVALILAVIYAVRFVALSRRRLRDAGRSAKAYLWLLLPGIGTLIFIIRLCGKSVITN